MLKIVGIDNDVSSEPSQGTSNCLKVFKCEQGSG